MSFPARWRVSDETPVCDRVAIMEQLALESAQLPSVKALAASVLERAKALAPFSPVKTGDWQQRILATEALRAVQSVQYVSAPEGEEWMQRGDYTLQNGGECKALSVLLCAICRILGVKSEILWITQTGRPINHVAARIFLDGEWFWADGSVRGAMLGESPYDAIKRLDAWHVVGGKTTPAGSPVLPAALPNVYYPFAWAGWRSLWRGWDPWWWNRHYPYLTQNYGNMYHYPVINGFYKV